ncbi:MAG: glycosyltransferase family 1 protein [Gammaproteobacteria bacterium]|nr:MAG: glycosyltransferase family 1 protein [Gammaproteobacteria bacterium]
MRVARRFRPDVVLAGSGLTAPIAWLTARTSGARAAVYLHGLDIVVEQVLYQTLWRPFFPRMDHVVVNSCATRNLAEQAAVPVDRLHVVPPGVSLPPPLSAAERAIIAREFRDRHGLGEGPLLLSVGRLTARKGLLEFVRDVLPLVVERIPDVRLLVIGDVPANALAARFQTPEQILAVAREAGMEHRIHFLGKVSEDELKAAYYAADVLVFPLREIPGDPEGFGMVAIEAAAHRLPTVAYASGGVVDAVRNGVSGWLVPQGGTEMFADRVIHILDGSARLAAPEEFATHFSWPLFGSRLAAALDLMRDRCITARSQKH